MLVNYGSAPWSTNGDSLFALPNPAKTIITRPTNLLYDDVVDGEPGGGKGGDDDDGDDDMIPRMPLGYMVL